MKRRDFFTQAACAGLGQLTFLNTLLNLKTLNASAISNSSVGQSDDYKAIVCILLAGGNDSFNMLIPYTQSAHNDYVEARSGLYTDGNAGLAIPRNMLTATKLNCTNCGNEYALHPAMAPMKTLFDQGKMALLANIGTLLRPTSLANYESDQNLPLGLFSHSDQIEEWQTGIPGQRSLIGWGGKMADLINDCNPNQNISMNISLSGSNIWQTGNQTVEYSISSKNGAVGIKDYDLNTNNYLRKARTSAIDSLLAHEYENVFSRSFAHVTRNARDSFLQFDAALENAIQFPDGFFPDNKLADSLQMISKVIDIRDTLQFKRQTFFIVVGGWDHHDEVIVKQEGLLGMVSGAMAAFQDSLGNAYVDMEDNVLTMIISEFGRTLSSNGNGSDHAWGGNTFVMGGSNLINGSKIYGNYPSLSITNPDPYFIMRRGRFIPTLSTDEYFAEVARWFGVPNSDLELLFPNIGYFYDTQSNSNPIDFINSAMI